MGIPEGTTFLEGMAPHMFVAADIADRYEEGLGSGPVLHPFQIHLDDERSRWNDTLADLFVMRFQQEYPNMTERNEIKKWFTNRIRTMKNTAARLVPRVGETAQQCETRLQIELETTYHNNRVRSRLFTVSSFVLFFLCVFSTCIRSSEITV